MNKNKEIGNFAEKLALEYLQSKGLELITQNFNSRFGEIDLIMSDFDSTLVFVEVRHRKNIDDAIESITLNKQRKLIKAAEYYLIKLGFDKNCRFDAVVIDNKNNIEWLKNVISVS